MLLLLTLAYRHILVLLYNLFLFGYKRLHARSSVSWIRTDSIQIKGQFVKLLPDTDLLTKNIKCLKHFMLKMKFGFSPCFDLVSADGGRSRPFV